MILRCYLVDDAEAHTELLARYIESFPQLRITGTETDPEKALAFLLQEDCPVDVVFLDIEMPGLPGDELARCLGGRYLIVFTTGHRNYGPEAYELRAVDYLLKPVARSRFNDAVKKAMERKADEIVGDDVIFIPGNGKNELLSLDKRNILYVKTEGNYVKVFTTGKEYTSYTTIKAMEVSLGYASFMRIHRCYLINMAQIDKVVTYSVFMKDNAELPISSTYRSRFMASVNARRPQEPA